MNYNTIKGKIADITRRTFSSTKEIEAEVNKIKKEISDLFLRTMKPSQDIIRKIQAAERLQQLELVRGLGKQYDQIAEEGLQVQRLYQELFQAEKNAAQRVGR